MSITSTDTFVGPAANTSQTVQMSWTQSQTYTNMAIAIPLYSFTSGAAFHVEAFLTTDSGLGAVPPPLATTLFTATTFNSVSVNAVLFSGLTLGPGTYYLTLSGLDPWNQPFVYNGAIWNGVQTFDSSLSLIAAPGVTSGNARSAYDTAINATYAPASFFSKAPAFAYLKVNITGDTVPEPTSALLTSGGLVALFIARRRLNRR